MGSYKDEQMRRHDPAYGRTRGEKVGDYARHHDGEPTALEITEALGGTWDARRSEGLACCPAHDDRNPSIVIFDKDDRGGDGRANFHCRFGCGFKDIIAALRKSHLWPEWFGNDVQFISEHVYQLADGTPYLRVARLNKTEADGSPKLTADGKQSKKFLQYHWDPDSESWKIGKPSEPQIPYHLPELTAAPLDRPVFIVEGEKCSDELNNHGLLATTNSEGAGKWTADLNPFFKGREVSILADNDKAGKNHALSVARQLHGVAASVRLVFLLDLPPKGDVSDWLAAGNDPSLLEGLCRSFKVFEPGTGDRDKGNTDRRERGADDVLTQLNQKYCVIRAGGKTRVLTFETENGRQVASFLSFEDFRNFHMNRRVGRERLGHWWLENQHRRTYEGIVFLPGSGAEVDGKLNLWRGWGATPVQGQWPLMQAHIEQVLASGDAKSNEYIHNWLAWAFQNPDKRAESVLVFKGKRGTGKGLLARTVLELFGQHGVHISSAEHLAGRFNGHLHDCCVLFADEAFWPGDKAMEGTLKRIVTEPTLFIERKGIDGSSVTNRLKIIMASNDDWVVPAGDMERRFAVFDASADKAQSQEWFHLIYEEMRDGGKEAMLFDLLHRDLAGWHPRKIVRTKALRDQQIRSLKPADQWRLTLLENGWLPGAGEDSCNQAPSYGANDAGLFPFARKHVVGLKSVSDHVLGQFLLSWKCEHKRWKNSRGWIFPPLGEMRALWEREYPEWEWEAPGLADWGSPEM